MLFKGSNLEQPDAPFKKLIERGLGKIAALPTKIRIIETFERIDNFEKLGKDLRSDPVKTALSLGTDKVRDAFVARHRTLGEYGQSLKDAIDRAKDLRTALDQCGRQFNPFQELDRAEPESSGAKAPGNGLWSVGPSFGGHRERAGRRQAQEDGIATIEHAIKQVDLVPNVVSLTIDSVLVRTITGSGNGRILLGRKGSLRSSEKNLRGGEYPLAFVVLDGDKVTFGTVTITYEETSDGKNIILTGESGTDHERIELFSCTGGRVLERTRCVCAPGLRWTGSACGCPPGQSKSGEQCVTCPATQVWEEGQCRCSAGSHWNTARCVSCPADSEWDGSRCATPRVDPVRTAPIAKAPTGSTCPSYFTEEGAYSRMPGGHCYKCRDLCVQDTFITDVSTCADGVNAANPDADGDALGAAMQRCCTGNGGTLVGDYLNYPTSFACP